MKISYEELFEILADEAIEILEQHDKIENQIKDVSHISTTKDVLKMIQEGYCLKTKVQTKISWKLKLLMVAIIIITLSSISFALTNKKPQLITGENQDLIENQDYLSIVVTDSNIGDYLLDRRNNVWKSSEIIKRVSSDVLLPFDVQDFTVKYEDGKYVIPQMIFWNGDMIVLTKEDGEGWILEKGDKIIIELQKYMYNDQKRRYVSLGYIYDGKLVDTEYLTTDLGQTIEFVAEENGEYHFCFVNVGSYSITFNGVLYTLPNIID